MQAGQTVIYDRAGLPGPQAVVATIVQVVKFPGAPEMYHVRFGEVSALVDEDCLTSTVAMTRESDEP